MTVTFDVLGMAFAAPTLTVPAMTIVAPLYVLAPESVCVPVPVLVNATWPRRPGSHR